MSIDLDKQQLAAIVRVLQSASDINIGDRAISEGIGALVVADVDRRFDSAPRAESGGQVYGGVTWPALSQVYLARNPIRAGGQILRDTGELQQSITGSGKVFKTGNNEVVIGTALPKARGLHFGMFWGRLIPRLARPILFIWDGFADQVVEFVAIETDRRLAR